MSAESLRGVAPVFPVSDVDFTASWYRDVIGFESSFAVLSRDGVEISLQRVDGYHKPDLSSRRAGGVWDVCIQDRWYGQREVEIGDPNGYVLVFAEQTTAVAP